MLKALGNSGLKRVAWSRIAPFSFQHLPGQERKEGALPLQHLFSKYYSDGNRYNKKGVDGKSGPTVRQKRIASEVREVISEALQQGPCINPLLQRCGFQIQKVKMSSDLRTAHVLWTALPGMQRSAEKAAISKVKRLRSLVFERLNLPFSPSIKFQEDKPNQEMLALEEAFAKLRASEGEDQNEGGDQNQSKDQNQGEDPSLSEHQSQGEKQKLSENQNQDDNWNQT